MAKTKAQIIAEAQVVKNATEVGENTATRVGGVLEDLADADSVVIIPITGTESGGSITLSSNPFTQVQTAVNAGQHVVVRVTVGSDIIDFTMNTYSASVATYIGTANFLQQEFQMLCKSSAAVITNRSTSNTFTTGESVPSVGIDATPTQGSNNLVKSGGVAEAIPKNAAVIKNVEENGVYISNENGEALVRLDKLDVAELSPHFEELVGNVISDNAASVNDIIEDGTYISNEEGDALIRLDELDAGVISEHFEGLTRSVREKKYVWQNSALSISSGVPLEIDAPYSIKGGNMGMSAHVEFSSFVEIIIGKGYQSYLGMYFRVTPTELIKCNYNASESQTSIAHGLNISSFINIGISSSPEGTVQIILQTLGGLFSTTYTGQWYVNGKTFLLPSGMSVSNVKLGVNYGYLKNKTWMFGDSYLGMSPERMPYYLHEYGYFNFMLDSLGGASSQYAYNDLIRCFMGGIPVYLLWFLGMNDSFDSWKKYFYLISRDCKQKGINLVVSTIPSVPSRLHSDINSVVRNSGVRYVDLSSAVCVDESTGEWYSGYLSSDNIHPTELGAKALFSKLLIDFPEIMSN